MPVREFVYRLLEVNERIKRSDSELCALIREAFPDSLLDVPISDSHNRIKLWRSEYNRGRMFARPSCCSFEYNSKRIRVNRHGNPLTAAATMKKMQQFRERFA